MPSNVTERYANFGGGRVFTHRYVTQFFFRNKFFSTLYLFKPILVNFSHIITLEFGEVIIPIERTKIITRSFFLGSIRSVQICTYFTPNPTDMNLLLGEGSSVML